MHHACSSNVNAVFIREEAELARDTKTSSTYTELKASRFLKDQPWIKTSDVHELKRQASLCIQDKEAERWPDKSMATRHN